MTHGIFGGGAQRKKMAHPLAYTPPNTGLSLRGLRGFGALGASNLPGTCWDAPGFKDCHAQAFSEAQTECGGGLARDAYGGDMDTCVERIADANTWAGCVSKYCPQSTKPTASGATTISWRNSSPNTTVKKLQTALNTLLKQNGANPIAADGILGSGTCGAAYWIDGVAGTSYYTDYGLAQICKTLTMPTKAGTKTPVTTITVNPQTTITKDSATTEKSALPWGVFDADTQAVQQRLNVQLDASDMNLLNTGGTLDAPTCGAMRWSKDTQGLDVLSVQGINCQGFTAPTKRIKAATPVVIPPASSNLPVAPVPSGSGINKASMATTGIIAGVLGVGVYFLGKHKHWF